MATNPWPACAVCSTRSTNSGNMIRTPLVVVTTNEDPADDRYKQGASDHGMSSIRELAQGSSWSTELGGETTRLR